MTYFTGCIAHQNAYAEYPFLTTSGIFSRYLHHLFTLPAWFIYSNTFFFFVVPGTFPYRIQPRALSHVPTLFHYSFQFLLSPCYPLSPNDTKMLEIMILTELPDITGTQSLNQTFRKSFPSP